MFNSLRKALLVAVISCFYLMIAYLFSYDRGWIRWRVPLIAPDWSIATDAGDKLPLAGGGTITEKRLNSLIRAASDEHGVDFSLIKAVVKVESAFDPWAVSRDGARGLMQLMPGTASKFGVDDCYDPEQNLDGGTRYLKRLLRRFKGDETLALAAYNAGEKAVKKYAGIPPFPETRRYVDRVMAYKARYKRAAAKDRI